MLKCWNSNGGAYNFLILKNNSLSDLKITGPRLKRECRAPFKIYEFRAWLKARILGFDALNLTLFKFSHVSINYGKCHLFSTNKRRLLTKVHFCRNSGTYFHREFLFRILWSRNLGLDCNHLVTRLSPTYEILIRKEYV